MFRTHCSLTVIPCLWFLYSYCFLFCDELWKWSNNPDVWFGAEHSTGSSLHIEQLWVSLLASAYPQEVSLVRDVSIYWYGDKIVGVGLDLCSFSRRIALDFPHSLWPIMVQVLGPSSSARYGFPLVEQILYPIRTWLITLITTVLLLKW